MHDVRALLPKREDGACLFSERWVREHVAPNKSRTVARKWAVSARDFEAWHDRWVANTLAEDELAVSVRQKRAAYREQRKHR